jgi:hypothetical protein
MIFLILTIIFFPISNSLECDCPARSLEHKFCESDFAIKIFVKTKEIEFKTGLRYKISLIEFYDKAFLPKKSIQSLNNLLAADSIGSAHDYPECVREFIEGKNYILTGKFDKVKPFTNKCEFGKESDSLNAEEQLFFSVGYKKINCSEFGSVSNMKNNIPMSPYREKSESHEKVEQDDENSVEDRDYDEDVVGYNDEDEESYEYDRDNSDEDDLEGIDFSELEDELIKDQDILDEDEAFGIGNNENYMHENNDDFFGGQQGFGDTWSENQDSLSEMEEDMDGHQKETKLRKRVKKILSKIFPNFMSNGSNIE